jgi:hypothetical protein
MKKIQIILLVISLVIISCNSSTDPDYNKNYESLANLDAKQAIALGNEWRDSAPQIKTHITSTEVIMEFPDGRVVKKTLPDSLMYIAVAPYINTTHECATHYPSSCEGELIEKQVKLIAKEDNGNNYFDGNITTLKHGFFEIWLPRNKNIKLTISYNSLTGEETIPTKSDSRTCITTIKLK